MGWRNGQERVAWRCPQHFAPTVAVDMVAIDTLSLFIHDEDGNAMFLLLDSSLSSRSDY
jgi:hypothetical protein